MKKSTLTLKKGIFHQTLSAISTRGTFPWSRGRISHLQSQPYRWSTCCRCKPTKNINQHTLAKNEVNLVVCLYDTDTGEFLGLQKWLAYIILRGDEEECLFSYGYSEKISKTLYSVAKKKIPNAIISTCLKKHYYGIMNERRPNEEFSALFFYLPSITDRKEKIKQH